MFQAEETQWVETQEHMAQWVLFYHPTIFIETCSGNNGYFRLQEEEEVVVAEEGSVDHINNTIKNKGSYLLDTFAIDAVLEV